MTMSQDTEKFLYFKVGLLKDSSALDALWQDALKHHMIDQPAKLIAMRLTEYYEIVSQGLLHPIAEVSRSTPQAAAQDNSAQEVVPVYTASSSNGNHDTNGSSPMTTPTANDTINRPAKSIESESTRAVNAVVKDSTTQEIFPVLNIADAEQNAEEAANYWNLL
jgi:hypothetical protein